MTQNRKPMTQDEESYLHFLQRQYARLDNDWAYQQLTKLTAYLDRQGK